MEQEPAGASSSNLSSTQLQQHLEADLISATNEVNAYEEHSENETFDTELTLRQTLVTDSH